MQRLMSIKFSEMLPKYVWEALIELRLFFISLTPPSITTHDMERIEAEIVQILCKLETIFVPCNFNCMEQLLVHFQYDPKIAGPVQHRWMYQFERLMCYFKM